MSSVFLNIASTLLTRERDQDLEYVLDSKPGTVLICIETINLHKTTCALLQEFSLCLI